MMNVTGTQVKLKQPQHETSILTRSEESVFSATPSFVPSDVHSIHIGSFNISQDRNEKGSPSTEEDGRIQPPKKKYLGPCSLCNLPLQKGSLIISFAGTILGLVFLTVGLVVLFSPKDSEFDVTLGNGKNTYEKIDPEVDKIATALEYGCIVYVGRGMLYTILFIYLGLAVASRSRSLILTWLPAHLTVLCTAFLISGLIASFYGLPIFLLLPCFALIPFETYSMYVVWAYTEELKVVGVIGGVPRIAVARPSLPPGSLDPTADIFTTGIYGPGVPDGEEIKLPDFAAHLRKPKAAGAAANSTNLQLKPAYNQALSDSRSLMDDSSAGSVNFGNLPRPDSDASRVAISSIQGFRPQENSADIIKK